MKKKKIERFETWADRILIMLRGMMYLKEWSWKSGHSKIDKGGEHQKITVAADIRIDLTYLNYDITIYPVLKEYYKEKKYLECFEALVHEMCHIYTEPLYSFAMDAVSNQTKDHLETIREQQTQRITGCIIELIPKTKWMPKIK